MNINRTKTYTAAQAYDADGIKTSFATATSATALTSADWDGAILNASAVLDLPRTITITLSNNANQFSTGDIVLTGIRGGSEVTETLNAADDDGNVTLRGSQIFDQLTAIDLPAMGGTGGTITIGVQDVCAPYGSHFAGIELAAAGTIAVGYGPDHAVASSDFIPVTTASVEEVRPIEGARRILTSTALSAPTAVGFTVYLAAG